MNNCGCEICNGKGWIETSVYNSKRIENGTVVIEKCDICNYFKNDIEAAKFGYRSENVLSFFVNGFNVKAEISFN